MRRRTLFKVETELVKPNKSVAGDICLYSYKTNDLIIVKHESFNSTYHSLEDYFPIGVVVVPGTHNVYGDGSCSVISLANMSYYKPDTGYNAYNDLYWGQDGIDISNMTNFTHVCYVGSNGKINQNIQGVKEIAYLPSDKFTKVKNSYDTDTYYTYKTSTDYYIPSPFNEYDTRNPAYYQTASPSSVTNVLSDFDGIGNTAKIINLATADDAWDISGEIENKYDSGYSPAACCCWRYHTEGTKQGDWYLPAMGELGYIMPKFNKINEIISNLITVYDLWNGMTIMDDALLWSSSEVTNYLIYRINVSNGLVYRGSKSDKHRVRAFLRVKQQTSSQTENYETTP